MNVRLKYGIIGGFGGLAPFVCQALAIFLPNLVGGPEKYDQLMAVLPQNSLHLTIFLAVLVTIFLIAATVVLATIEADGNDPVGKAFLLGVSVPAMILSLANGASNSNKALPKTAPPAVPAKASYWDGSSPGARSLSVTEMDDSVAIRPASLSGPGLANRFVTTALPALSQQKFRQLVQDKGMSSAVSVSVHCDDCFAWVNLLPELIQIVSIQTAPVGGAFPSTPTFINLPRAPSGRSASAAVDLTVSPSRVLFSVPTADDPEPNNPYIAGPKTKRTEFTLKAGESHQLTVYVRPDNFNQLRGFFGKVPRFVVTRFE
jgi:hypothetical protein